MEEDLTFIGFENGGLPRAIEISAVWHKAGNLKAGARLRQQETFRDPSPIRVRCGSSIIPVVRFNFSPVLNRKNF
jgi:hypothetical protein